MSFDHDNAYGSARFALPEEITHAGLFEKKGLPFGLLHNRGLYHDNGAGVLIVGGAGSAKTTAWLIPMIMQGGNFMVLDPKGENTAVILDGMAAIGGAVYCINPYQVFGYPNHRVSLLSHLKAGSSTLVGDSRRLCMTLLPNVSGSNNRFFDEKARLWADAIVRGIIVERGSVSFRSLYDAVNMIRSDWEAWLDRACAMAVDGPPDLEAVFSEMNAMNAGEAKTFDSVMSGITNALAFMADPANRETFVDDHEADFSLDVLTKSDNPVVVFVIMPPELIAPNAPVIRQCFSTMRTVKQRAAGGKPVALVIDEAASLGAFPEIAEFYSIGRGFGIMPVTVYQDQGQIQHNLGKTGAQTLSANAALECYLGGGVRDLDTAQNLSRRLGNQTIALDDKLTQESARHAKQQAMRKMLFEGADPWQTGQELRHQAYAASHQRHQSRALMEPNEILSLDAGKTLVLAGGYQLPPFLIDKVPYYQRRDLAGRFFPNPYVSQDMHSVRVRTRFGYRTRQILEEPVPSWLAHLPQYADGQPLRYVEGFKPKRR